MRFLAYSLSSLFLLLYLLYLHELSSGLASILNVVDTNTQFIGHNAVDNAVVHNAVDPPPCALFFYGLAKRVDLTLPSTFSKIINKNPECTVIYQSQNVTHTSTPHALWDSESGVINYDALYVHESPTFKIILTGGDTGESKSFPSLPFLLSKCCAPGYTDTSMSNLHKSWESLETLLPFIDNYETVGIFRNDVIFIDEVGEGEREREKARRGWGDEWMADASAVRFWGVLTRRCLLARSGDKTRQIYSARTLRFRSGVHSKVSMTGCSTGRRRTL